MRKIALSNLIKDIECAYGSEAIHNIDMYDNNLVINLIFEKENMVVLTKTGRILPLL